MMGTIVPSHRHGYSRLHPPTEKRRTDSCSLPSEWIPTRSLLSASRTNHLETCKSAERPIRRRGRQAQPIRSRHSDDIADLPECVPMTTTAPLGWNSAQCPCSCRSNTPVSPPTNQQAPVTSPAPSPPECGSTAGCDPESSRDKPSGPERRSGTAPCWGGWPDPTARPCVPERTAERERDPECTTEKKKPYTDLGERP